MKRFLFLFFATLFALTTWAYSVTDDSTGTTIYYNTVDDGLEVTYGGMMYGSTTSYCVDEVIIPEYVSGTPVVGIGADAFDYCTLKAVSLPSTLQYIRDSGFYECGNLKEIDIPEGVTVIEGSAFYHCYALEKVNIPSGVTSISEQTFYGCSKLTSIELPAGVTSIGNYAFRSCTGLTSVTCLATTPPTCSTTAFQSVTTSGVNLYVPSESVSDYEAHEVWKGFNIQAIDDGGDTGGSYTIVFSPANGGTETLPEGGLQEFVISCEDGIAMSSNHTWALRGEEVSSSFKSIASSNDGKSLTITLSSTITTAGTYSLAYSIRGSWNTTIPAGTFLLGPNGEVESDEMSYSFTLVEEDSGSDDPYTVEPDEDVVQQSLSYVKFIAEGAICYSEEIDASAVKVYKDEVEVASGASVQDDYTSGTWDDAVNIYFDTTIVEKGDYKVVVPAGFMNLGSWTVYNDEITLYYTIDGSLDTGGGTGDDGDHEGDYLTAEIMGLDASNTSNQDFTYTGPSGTVYAGNARYLSSGNYAGDINFYASNGYLKNTESVGYLRKVIFEADENSTESSIFYVRASNEPWSGSNFTSYGTAVGQVAINEGGTVDIEGDYAYFACYGGSSMTSYRFKSIEVVWETEGGGDHEYSIDPDPDVEQSSLQKFTFTSYEGFVADEEGTTEYKGTVSIYKDGSTEPYATTTNIDSDWDSSINDVGDIWLFFEFENEITEAGEYEFVIPAGLFYWLDGEDIGSPNDEMRFSYTVTGSTGTGSGDHEYSIDPDPDVEQSSLQKFTFTSYEGFVADEEGTTEYKGTVSIYKDGDSEPYAITSNIDSDWDSSINDVGDIWLFFEFENEITEAGEYEFVIPAGLFYWLDGEDIGSPNDEMRFSYTVTGGTGDEGAIPAGYILDPAHESYVETLSTISIYPESGSLSLNDYNAVGVVMSKTGGQVGTVTFSDDYDDELQMGWCIATLSEEISDMGTYYVTFPAGVFYNFGEDAANPEFTATYYVTGSADEGEYSFAPAYGSTLTSLESFDVCHSISICCAWDQTLLITVEDENGNTVAYGADCVDNWPDSWDDPCLSCTIILNTKIVAAGMYTISIPAGYFVVGENDLLSEALTITYIVDGSEDPGTETGIGGININDENVEGIYSTSGQKLNKAQKGVNIIRYTDGSVKKLYVK